MSIIAAGNTTTTALVQTADTTGNLVFTTGGANTTALTITNAQNATFANAVTITGAVTQTGNATFSANVSVAGSISSVNTFGFKNRLINGNMVIDQRSAGASVTQNTSGTYTLDRWVVYGTVTSKFTVQQNAGSVTPPAGYINYLGATSSSAYSIVAADEFTVNQIIEGLNLSDLAWGTASAKTVTLSFQVYSSLTGTFGGALRNTNTTRSYPFSYSIPVANTWTSISITIAGDTTGTWLTTNGAGIRLDFSLGTGTTQSGTAGAWAATNYTSATGAVSVVGTSGATFYITGVQFEVGSQATSFDFRSYGTEFSLCQRYFETSYNQGVAVGTATATGVYYTLGASDSSGSIGTVLQFKVTKRTTPTLTPYTQGGAAGWQYLTAVTSGTAAVNVTFLGASGGLVFNNSGAASIAAQIFGQWTASAEL